MNGMKIMQAGLIVMLAIACILGSGCISQNQNETGQRTETTTNPDTLYIGYQPSTHQMAFMTAFSKGWYQEELKPFGIETIKDYQFPTGAPEMQAMLAGDLDFAYVGAAPFVTAVSNGLDGKIIAAVQTQGSALVIRTGLIYNSPEDLKGLTIATFPSGTIQDTLLRTWLSENNIDPDTDVSIKAMGPGDATTAIIAGQIDATFLPAPAPTAIEGAGAGYTIVQSGDMFPNHACCVLVASNTMIQDHPDIVQQVLAIHKKASEYNKENSSEAATIMSGMTGMDVAVIMKSLEDWDGHFVADPHLINDSVTSYATIQYELGYLTNPVSQDDLFDFSFWDKQLE